MARDRDHRRARTISVVQAVDQVQVARTARAGARDEFTGDLGIGAGCERSGFLVAHVDPVDPTFRRTAGAAHGVDHRVETVADDAVDAADAGVLKLSDELISNGCHGSS